jgi:putative ABC transport system substrate-binding protein
MADGIVKNVEASAPIFGLPVEILHASTDHELVAALSGLLKRPGAVLLVTVDGFFFNRRALIVTLAARYALPTVYYSREYAEVGGLISYGSNVENVLELTGIYTGRILKGEKPADLPVAQPTKFELVVNLVTAKALGFDIPPKLLALADEVIE